MLRIRVVPRSVQAVLLLVILFATSVSHAVAQAGSNADAGQISRDIVSAGRLRM